MMENIYRETHRPGRIEVICGSMFSGKTEELIRRMKRAKFAKQKVEMLDAAKMLIDNGYKLYATAGTSKFLTENGIENTHVLWPSEEGDEPKALDLLHNHTIDMVVNIPKNLTSSELSNGYKIRRAAIDLNVPLITNARLASAFIYAFCTTKLEDIGIKAWNEY